jgi:hypothetical protein
MDEDAELERELGRPKPCQHINFEERMDGHMTCKDCGLEGYTDVLTGEVLKHCVSCGAAHDTAVLWKLRCSGSRHNFKL